MKARRPEVFISAASADLRSCRQLVKEGLLTLGCVPVEQTNFPPDYRRVHDMLRSKIAGCDAVIHVVGECYGAEPGGRARGAPRRSYTHLEYDLARELRKPLYIFLCDPNFAFDRHESEDMEKQRLQQAHRAAIAAADHLRCEVGSRADLAIRVRELQTSVEHLKRELMKARSWLGRGVAVTVVVMAILGAGMWLLNQRAGKTEQRVIRLETEIERQRHYAAAVFEAYRKQQSESDVSNRLGRAVAVVAKREAVSPATVQSAIRGYVMAIRANPNAAVGDPALADFAERNFGGGKSAPARNAVSEVVPRSSPALQGGGVRAELARSDNSQPSPQSNALAVVLARMQARQPAIFILKNREIVGENNRGFLEIRGEATSGEVATISDENGDRAAVYAAVAMQTRTTAEMVGRKRAEQIAGLAKPGYWIQSPSGMWMQKP